MKVSKQSATGHEKDAVKEGARRLPHERDESEDSQADKPRKIIRQAYEDLQHGLVDTSRQSVQGVDDRERDSANQKK